jgi:hypothetical protein
MKRNLFIIPLLLVLAACNQNRDNSGSGSVISSRVRRQVMDIAVGYTRDKFKESQQSVLNNGVVRIGDQQLTCIIDPATIVTGLIDSDANEDAIVTVTTFKGRFRVKTEHLILVRTNRKLALARAIEADMKIMGIKEMIVYAEISKFPSDSPAADCQICKEIVKYQFRDGNLVRAE